MARRPASGVRGHRLVDVQRALPDARPAGRDAARRAPPTPPRRRPTRPTRTVTTVVAAVAHCLAVLVVAIEILGLRGQPPGAVPYTFYSQYADVMWDVAMVAGRRNLGAPSVWYQSMIYLSADWAPAKFRSRFRVPKELAEMLVYGLSVSTCSFTDNRCQNPLHRCVLCLCVPQ